MKNFDDWHVLKKNLNTREVVDKNNKVKLLAKSRELWWCHVGLNIGSEEDGKNDEFQRPVIIINRLSSTTYLVAPTTSKFKENIFRLKMTTIDGKFSYALIDQIKVIDVRRMNPPRGRASRYPLRLV
jgi:mRNA-degrading endonuclease toxin of MazEF toxin-antitoxin module